MGFANLHIHSNYSFVITAVISSILKYAADFTALDLINALQNRPTIPRQGKVWNGAAILTSYTTHRMLRKTGWVSWNTGSESSIKYACYSQVYQRVQCSDPSTNLILFNKIHDL